MSDKVSDKEKNEEVDLGHLFSAIGRLFERLFSFILKLFKGAFHIIIILLKPLVNNLKLVSIVLMIAAILGFVMQKFAKPVYASDMLVRPYFDSKYQLSNNVDYFNALIASENRKELSNIFEIDTLDAKKLLSFEMEIGPETQNDLLKEYDDYIKSIDSTIAAEVSYEEFIENRDILAGNIFSIKVRSTKNDIFKSLENGFINTLENEYSQKVKRRIDSIRLVKRENYVEGLERVKSLQDVYIDIKKKESEKGDVTVSGGIFPLAQEKTSTKEFELFQEELKIRTALRALDETGIEEEDFYDILSGFEEVGSKESNLYNKYPLFFPVIAFVVLVLIYVMLKIYKFIKEYEQ